MLCPTGSRGSGPSNCSINGGAVMAQFDMESEHINPHIPWLYGFKLDFRFR